MYSHPFWRLYEEPRVFYPYTRYALKYLFEKNGFEIGDTEINYCNEASGDGQDSRNDWSNLQTL